MAARGEDIGIFWKGEIIALRPVQVFSEDYALNEYALDEGELDHITRNIEQKAQHEKKTGKAKRWDGSLKGLRG